MTFSKKAKTENKKQLHHNWKWQKGIKNGWKQISLYCHLIRESEGTRLLQTIIRKYVCCSGSHRLSLNHDPNGKKPCEAVWHMEAIYSKSALWFGEVRVFRYIHSKFRENRVTYGGYMHAVADRLPEVPGHDKWIGKTGWRGCCHFIPRQGCGLGGDRSSWCCWNTTEYFVHFYPLYGTVFDFKTGKIYVANSW